jgi:hypothetical protein
MIVSNYTRLFSIEFLHESYNDPADIFHDIYVIPDEDTLQILNGYRIKCKTDKNKLFCFVQTKALIDTSSGSVKVNIVNKPLVSFNENATLNFKISIKSSQFLNSSNLRRYYSKDKLFRFGNDSGNKRDTLFSLSNKIPAYKNSDPYKPGMLVTNAGNQTFEAIKESDSAHPQNTTKTQFWSHVTDLMQYVNQSDLIPDDANENCFAVISISFDKSLPNKFSLLKKSSAVSEDNTIIGKDYFIQFKTNAVN